MSDAAPARPRQVTVAAWLIILGSVFVVVSAFGQVSASSSLETRERVEELLADPPASGLGLSVSTVVEALRVIAMVAAATAAATGILGSQVLQRSRAARLWLSVLAVPLFLTAAFTGGFMGALVAAAVVMLWLQPARSWFAGEPLPERFRPDGTLKPRESAAGAHDPQRSSHDDRTRERDRQPAGGAPPAAWPPPQPVQPPQAQPPSQPPSQPGQPGQQPPPAPAPYPGFGSAQAGPQHLPGARPAQQGPARRPASLVWACALTWVGSALVSLALAFTAVALAAFPDDIFTEAFAQQPDLEDIGRDTITQGVYGLTAVCVLWSLAACVVAVLAFRGVGWAKVALTVSAGAVTGLFLVLTLSSVVMVVPLAASATAFALLLRPDVRAWQR